MMKHNKIKKLCLPLQLRYMEIIKLLFVLISDIFNIWTRFNFLDKRNATKTCNYVFILEHTNMVYNHASVSYTLTEFRIFLLINISFLNLYVKLVGFYTVVFLNCNGNPLNSTSIKGCL